MGEIYSPTRTQRWLDCPMLLDLDSRWEPKAAAWTPNMLLGTAIHKGLEWYYQALQQNYNVEENNLAYDWLRQTIEEGYVHNDTWTVEGLVKLGSSGLREAIKTGLPLGGRILSVEEDLDGCIPDLVYRSDSGPIVVIDHKVTLSLKSEYAGSRLAEYESNWQLAHYAWRVGQEYGEPVGMVGVHLIALSPKAKAYPHFITFTPERLEMWLGDAEKVWEDMERGISEQRYRRNWQYCQRWGAERRCSMYHMCHDLAGDESRASLFYDRKVEEE